MRLLLWLAIALLCAGPALARPGPGHGGGKPPSAVQTIASITPTSCSFASGTQNGPVCTLSVTMNPASPSFSGTLALCTGTNTPVSGCSGVNTGGFHLSGSTIEQSTGGSGTPVGTYTDVTAYAAQGGITTIFQSLTLTGSTFTATNEEFVGPFASWRNVKTDYGAVGNGTTDDTAAIQAGLNAFSSSRPVLYFPAGTYKITSSLTMAGRIAAGIVGADPATTSIVWAGSGGGTMFSINGITSSRINRITFNGTNTAAVIIDQSYDNVACCFDTDNQYADDVFENSGIAFRCGNLGFGCAETTMLRDQFINNTGIGILMKNFNALDMWVWYSTFQNNFAGVGNYIPGGANGGGAFQVYNSVFQNTTTADITYANTGVFNIRNNYSIGSNTFINDLGTGGTGAEDTSVIQGNTVLDTGLTQSIHQADEGPMILLDNVIRSKSGGTFTPSPCTELGRRAGTCPVVMVGDYNSAEANDLFSMGNTFTLGSGSCASSTSGTAAPAAVNGRCHSINDQIVSRSTVNPSAPTLPGTPPNLARTIYEASTTGSGTTCSIASPCTPQQAITNAAAGCVNNVAHLQPGSYSIASTITVPANCGVQIIGDNGNSILVSSGADPVMRLAGPSLATLRDFGVNGISEGQDGIEITVVDAGGLGGMVFVEDGPGAGNNINLFVDSIDYTNVEAHNFQNLYNNSASTGGVTVSGGAHGAQYNQYLGLDATFQGYGFSFSGAANANVTGIWNETPSSITNLLKVTGTGTVTYAGSQFETPNNVLNSAAFTNFTGTAAVVGLAQDRGCPSAGTCGAWGNYSITGTGTGGNVLGLGLTGPSDTYWLDTSGDTNQFISSRRRGVSTLTEIGDANSGFMTATLAQLRSHQPTLPGALSGGQTNVAIYRVDVNNARYGIHLVHN